MNDTNSSSGNSSSSVLPFDNHTNISNGSLPYGPSPSTLSSPSPSSFQNSSVYSPSDDPRLGPSPMVVPAPSQAVSTAPSMFATPSSFSGPSTESQGVQDHGVLIPQIAAVLFVACLIIVTIFRKKILKMVSEARQGRYNTIDSYEFRTETPEDGEGTLESFSTSAQAIELVASTDGENENEV